MEIEKGQEQLTRTSCFSPTTHFFGHDQTKENEDNGDLKRLHIKYKGCFPFGVEIASAIDIWINTNDSPTSVVRYIHHIVIHEDQIEC